MRYIKKNQNGLSLASVMIGVLMLSLFSLLLAQVLGMTQKQLSAGLRRNEYEQTQAMILYSARSINLMRNALATTFGETAAARLQRCFEANTNGSFNCSEFNSPTYSGRTLRTSMETPMNMTMWGPGGVCDPASGTCMFKTSIEVSFSCNQNQCFSVGITSKTEQMGAWTDEQRMQMGMPPSDLGGRLRKTTMLASQFSQKFENPKDPTCESDSLGYVALDYENNGFLCGTNPLESNCQTSLRHILAEDCVWSAVGRSGSGARATTDRLSYEIDDDCTPSVNIRFNLESYGEITQSNYNAANPSQPVVATSSFFLQGQDSIAFACPGLFQGTRSISNPIGSEIVTLDADRCPSSPIHREYSCSVFVRNAQGLAKGSVGNFELRLIPIPTPVTGLGGGPLPTAGSGTSPPGGGTGGGPNPTNPPVLIDVPSGSL